MRSLSCTNASRDITSFLTNTEKINSQNKKNRIIKNIKEDTSSIPSKDSIKTTYCSSISTRSIPPSFDSTTSASVLSKDHLSVLVPTIDPKKEIRKNKRKNKNQK